MDHLKKPHAAWFFIGMLLLSVGPRGLAAGDAPIATREEIQKNLLEVPCDNEARIGAVKDLFLQLGASESDVSIARFKQADNVVVTVKGSGEGYIVVGAHYDKVKPGCGAIDNWTGVVILAHLWRSLRETKPLKTVVFVAFGKEESGLEGSRAMADGIPKEERRGYCSMVNLDSFGFAGPQVLENVSTPRLTSFVASVAKENRVPFASATVAANADSSSFKAKGIPAVTLHGLSNNWQTVLHTDKDQTNQVDVGSVYLGYRLSLLVIGRLDESACSAFR